MKLQDLLKKNSILIDLKGNDKTELLTQIAHYMISLYSLSDSNTITRKILERELEVSTGIGYGIAIPHARVSGIDHPYMVAARTVEGIEFKALDEQPVSLIFMMVSPVNTSVEHTQILSSLSQIMSYEEVRTQLLTSESCERFLEVVTNGENKYVE